MQPVDSVAQVMQVLRRQMAENLQRMRGSGKLAAATPAAAASVARTATPLRQTLARRIKAIDADDPRYPDKVAALFVESVLLAEFGESLVNDPEFRYLAQQVQSAMLADANLQGSLTRLAAQLRAAA
jgi:hypothetical protein